MPVKKVKTVAVGEQEAEPKGKTGVPVLRTEGLEGDIATV